MAFDQNTINTIVSTLVPVAIQATETDAQAQVAVQNAFATEAAAVEATRQAVEAAQATKQAAADAWKAVSDAIKAAQSQS